MRMGKSTEIALKKAWNRALGQQSTCQFFFLHVPKTAGTSFFSTLRVNYSRTKIIRLDEEHLPHSQNERLQILREVFDSFPVVGGHLRFSEIATVLHQDTKVVTWLRDPVDRLVSNYRYNRYRWERDGKSVISLEEYVRKPNNRDKMSQFLEGASLDQFYFVGVVEHFKEDLNMLANALGWKRKATQRNNITPGPAMGLSHSVRTLIQEYNPHDVALYQQALELRKQRF